MSRVWFVQDALGERRFSEADFPLAVGGAARGGVVLPGAGENDLFALLGLSDGYAYVQPVDDAPPVYLNHEQLTASAWLKSADQLQFGDDLLTWTVKGDQVFLRAFREDPALKPVPPAEPPPAQKPVTDLPVMPVEQPAGGGRRLRRVLIGLFAILVLALMFLLLAVPVGVQISPAPQTRELTGFPPPIAFGERLLVLPGRYRLRASLEGYHPLDETIEVSRAGPRDFGFTLQELPGRVRFVPDPSVPFELKVDGDPVEPDREGTAHLLRGTRQIEFRTARYLPVNLEVDVEGLGREQVVELALQPAWAEVRIDSRPPGARVLVDDEDIGVTPLATEILRGRRRIELQLEGYKRLRLERAFQAGQVVTIDELVLEPDDGRLVLNSTPEGATVTIDDRYYGVTPVTLELASGIEHRVRLARAGYLQAKERLVLKAGEERELHLRLPPQFGTVFVSTVPADASVRVDGKTVDGGPRLRLTTRAHTLEVSKPGYRSKRVTVTPEAGVSKTVKIALSREGGSSGTTGTSKRAEAALPATYRTAAGQTMRLVRPQGVLNMGASRREAGRRANESRRKVELVRPFYLSSTEVTNAQFRRFQSSHDSGRLDGVNLNGDAQPVVNVSWDDAARYCNWLSKQEGLPPAYVEQGGHMQLQRPVTTGYRLPTEAEWAWVARREGRRSEARYPWNGTFPPSTAAGNYADRRIADTLADVVPGYDDGYRGTAPAGSFPEWPAGFHDLGGNVAEWVNDYYTVYPVQTGAPARDPLGPVSGEHHTVRGAGWRHGNITELRLSYRDYSRKPRPDLGFRIARYPDPL